MKKKQVKETSKKQFKILRLLTFIIAIITNVSLVYLAFSISRYSSLSQAVFVKSYIALIVLVVIINVMLYFTLVTRKRMLILSSFSIILVIMLASFVGSYYVYRINQTVDEIVVNNEDEEYSVVFVTYDNKKISNIDDLSGVKFGIIDSDNFMEGNILAREELDANDISVDYKYYSSYNDLLLALFDGDVDVISLPSNYKEYFNENEGYSEYLDKTTIIHEFDAKRSATNDLGNDIDVTTEPFTVLLLGIDGTSKMERSDTIMVASFNPQTMTVTLTSIARDSYVPIACYTNQKSDKINHSYMVNRQCTINTVENLLGIKIDFFIEANFKAVVDIVDALDGLLINNPVTFVGQTASDDRGTKTVYVEKGIRYLTGEQVLAFARERHAMPGGDFQRQENQQQVISALAKALLETRDVNSALKVLDAAGANLKTNFSLTQMIALFNHGLTAMNNSYINSFAIVKISNSRITGYASSAYNDSLELPLWIYKPYKGALKDTETFINDNLDISKNIMTPVMTKFRANWQYYEPAHYKDVYDEAEVHEPLPDIMPHMVNDKWSYEKALAWAKERNITLTVNWIEEGNAKYSDSYAHHQIIDQDINYGKKTANFSKLTIDVIRKKLNCADTNNQSYVECYGIIPDFVGAKYDSLTSWKTNNSYSINIERKYIKSDSSEYVAGKIGTIAKITDSNNNSIVPYITKVTDISGLIVYTYDYPYISIKPSVGSVLPANFIEQFTAESNVTVIKEYDKTKAEGTIISFNPTSLDKIRTNDLVTVTVTTTVEPTITVPNFIGMTKDAVSAWFTTNLSISPTFTPTEGDESSKDLVLTVTPDISGRTDLTKTAILDMAPFTITYGTVAP